MTLTVGSLFSGIGGIDLGLERAGMKVLWQVEIDEWCRAVLAKHWPDVERFEDVRGVGAGNLPRVDLIAGGFPCQPVSNAGKRLGRDDVRWLWPEFARVIRELRPSYVFVENVAILRARGLDEIQSDLATLGYDTEWDCLPASSFGAPHDRDRIFLVAYTARVEHEVGASADGRQAAQVIPLADTNTQRRDGRPRELGSSGWSESQDRSASLENADSGPVEPRRRRWRITEAGEVLGWGAWAAPSGVDRMAHGIPARLDRLAGLGNAVVPQVVEWIGRRIVEAEGQIEQ